MNMASSAAAWRLLALLTLGALAAPPTAAADAAGAALLTTECGDCHKPRPDGSLERIADARRSPEGWDMVVGRMSLIHKVQLGEDKRRALVKYLSDAYGLSPAESKPWHYVLERRTDSEDRFEDQLVGDTCARCHTYARIALQRRTEAEWLKLSHFHVGQYPTAELQSNGRDRDWWDIASKQLPPLLAKLYPLQSESWSKWQAQTWVKPSGSWRLVGHRPGRGDYEGQATVKENAANDYSLEMELRYADGKSEKGSGKLSIFTGYEWRASLTLGDKETRQVFALSEDGSQLSGRWYLRNVDTLGGDISGVKQGARAAVLAVYPGYLRAGTKQQLAIHGSGLAGRVDLGPGLRVLREISRSADSVVVEVQAAKKSSGSRTVRVGELAGKDLLKVYQRIDYLRIEPARGLARVGDDAGKIPRQPMAFEAAGYVRSKGGKKDLRIGIFPAQWSFDNANATAKAFDDARFAGAFEDNGVFMPAVGGPNPKRKFGTNNAGDLKVTATVKFGKRKLKASAPLIVTVQRWVDPPVR